MQKDVILDLNFMKIHNAKPSHLELREFQVSVFFFKKDDQNHISVVNSEFSCFLS